MQFGNFSCTKKFLGEKLGNCSERTNMALSQDLKHFLQYG
jgi:hypothetical protein